MIGWSPTDQKGVSQSIDPLEQINDALAGLATGQVMGRIVLIP